MPTPAFCSACGKPPPAGAASCPACDAAFEAPPPRKPERRLDRDWRARYASSSSTGMAIGFVVLCVVTWLLLGLFVSIAALVVLGLLWVLRAMFGRPAVAPGVERKRAERDRHRRAAKIVAARRSPGQDQPS